MASKQRNKPQKLSNQWLKIYSIPISRKKGKETIITAQNKSKKTKYGQPERWTRQRERKHMKYSTRQQAGM